MSISIAETVSGVFGSAVVLNGVYVLKGQSMPPIQETLINAAVLTGAYLATGLINEKVLKPIIKENKTLDKFYNGSGGVLVAVSMNMAIYAATRSYLTGQPLNIEDAVVALFNVGTFSYAAAPVTIVLDTLGID